MKAIPLIFPLLVSGIISKKSSKKVPYPTYRGIIEIKHFIPGRIRYYIPSLVGNLKELKNLKKILKDFDNINSVEGSDITGSVLIEYENIDPSLITGILIHLLKLQGEIDKPVVGRLYKDLSTISKSINRGIYEETKGLLDFNTIISFSLGIFGIRSLFKRRFMSPGAWTLLWWFYNTTMNLDKKGDNK